MTRSKLEKKRKYSVPLDIIRWSLEQLKQLTLIQILPMVLIIRFGLKTNNNYYFIPKFSGIGSSHKKFGYDKLSVKLFDSNMSFEKSNFMTPTLFGTKCKPSNIFKAPLTWPSKEKSMLNQGIKYFIYS